MNNKCMTGQITDAIIIKMIKLDFTLSFELRYCNYDNHMLVAITLHMQTNNFIYHHGNKQKDVTMTTRKRE